MLNTHALSLTVTFGWHFNKFQTKATKIRNENYLKSDNTRIHIHNPCDIECDILSK